MRYQDFQPSLCIMQVLTAMRLFHLAWVQVGSYPACLLAPSLKCNVAAALQTLRQGIACFWVPNPLLYQSVDYRASTPIMHTEHQARSHVCPVQHTTAAAGRAGQRYYTDNVFMKLPETGARGRSARSAAWSARRRAPPRGCWTSWSGSCWRASASTPHSSATTRGSCRRWPSSAPLCLPRLCMGCMTAIVFFTVEACQPVAKRQATELDSSRLPGRACATRREHTGLGFARS